MAKMQVASSLNSSHCYILQDNGLFLTWLGGLSSTSDHNILDMIMSKLCVRRIHRANPFFLSNLVVCMFSSELL